MSQYGQATYSAEGGHDGAYPRRGGPVEVEKSSAPYVEAHVSEATASVLVYRPKRSEDAASKSGRELRRAPRWKTSEA